MGSVLLSKQRRLMDTTSIAIVSGIIGFIIGFATMGAVANWIDHD